MLGIAVAETLARPTARRIVRRPARFVLATEIVVLIVVGVLPRQVPDQVVTAAIAFASALQISTFRSLEGVDYSTTLTTSNLRTLVAKAYSWRADHDVTAGRQAARISAVIAGFAVGAGVGALCTHFFGPTGGVGGSGHAGPRARRHRHRNGDPLPPRPVRGSHARSWHRLAKCAVALTMNCSEATPHASPAIPQRYEALASGRWRRSHGCT
jgi:hypothetical protein